MAITRVHHLNCGTMRPLGRQLSAVMPRDLVARCLLVERPDGLTAPPVELGLAAVSRNMGAATGPDASARGCRRVSAVDTVRAGI